MRTSLDLAVGHPQIDAQHRELERRVEEVRARLETGDGDGLVRALGELWDEVVSHFAAEEALMEASGYPERSAHATAHRLYLEDLRELQRLARECGLCDEVREWADRRSPEWLVFHAQTNDAPLARFLLRRMGKMVAGAVTRKPPDA